MSLEALKKNADQTAAGLDELAEILGREPGLETVITGLHERAEKLRNDRFTVVVVGEFKRGKSTLLNALLGQRVLPQKAAPCTAVLTIVRDGDPLVRVVHGNGDELSMSPEEFTRKYELKVEDTAYDAGSDSDMAHLETALTQEVQDRFGDIDHAVVQHPIELCRNGVELVDSPGLSEHPARERRVLEYLREADAVVMVLSATQLLNQREIRFIQHTLTPLGLRKNVFFLINRWNQILEGLVDPNDPEEVRAAFTEQQQLIDARLKPLCLIDGVNLSDTRIYCIDALAALRQRIAARPVAAALEGSNVPAFEASLERFLRDERCRARQEHDRALIYATRAALRQHAGVQLHLAGKPLEELEKKDLELQPQLEKLREVGRHIDHYLASKVSQVADELTRSFDAYMDEEILRPLPEAVRRFDLGRADGVLMSFDAALDLIRPENTKFKNAVVTHLQSQVARYLRPKLTAWSESLRNEYLRRISREVEDELRREAGNYVEIIDQIEHDIGGQAESHSAREQVGRWLDDLPGPPTLNGSINNVGLDLAPLISTVLIDVASHMMFNFLPGIGFLISGVLILLRRNRMRERLRAQIVEGMTAKMPEFRLSQHEAIRAALTAGFNKIGAAITTKIGEDIALIDASLKSLIRQKKSHAFSLNERRGELQAIETELNEASTRVLDLLKE